MPVEAALLHQGRRHLVAEAPERRPVASLEVVLYPDRAELRRERADRGAVILVQVGGLHILARDRLDDLAEVALRHEMHLCAAGRRGATSWCLRKRTVIVYSR